MCIYLYIDIYIYIYTHTHYNITSWPGEVAHRGPAPPWKRHS